MVTCMIIRSTSANKSVGTAPDSSPPCEKFTLWTRFHSIIDLPRKFVSDHSDDFPRGIGHCNTNLAQDLGISGQFCEATRPAHLARP